MNRFCAVTLLGVFAAALVGAQGPSSRTTPDQQSRLLQQNRALLKVTVERSLDLSEKYGSLERAGVCTKLAEDWSDAIRQAVQAKDAARVQELGGHFDRVIGEGVLANLKRARADIRRNSLEEGDLFKQRDETIRILDGLNKNLDGADEFRSIRQSLQARRAAVESATKLEK